MKKLLLAIFSLISVISYSQTTGYLRYDTVRVQRGGGNSTLVIENATRTLTNGFLQNYAEGRTKFAYALDSVWIDGDSIRFRYGTTTLAVLLPIGEVTQSALDDSTAAIRADHWAVRGNAIAQDTSKFIGTTDSSEVALRFRINNYNAGYLGFSYQTSNPPYTNDGNNYTGMVALGYRAGDSLRKLMDGGTTVGTNSVAIGADALRDNSVAQNTAIGNNAMKRARTMVRNTIVGQGALQYSYTGSFNVGMGTFVMEVQDDVSGGTAIGMESQRGNKQGVGNTSVGGWSLAFGSAWVDAITVTNGGSGYTTATVTISAPDLGTPGTSSVQATATATINSGAITAITLTNKGMGYSTSKTPLTVTITGDGTGATATASLRKSENNTAIGYVSSYFNQVGRRLTTVGAFSGYGLTSAFRTLVDDDMTLIGYNATRGDSRATSVPFINSTGVGSNVKVNCDSCFVLGPPEVSTTIGASTVNASAKLEITSTTKGFLPPRMSAAQRVAISSPATALFVWDSDSARYMGYNGSTYKGIAWTDESGGGSNPTLQQVFTTESNNAQLTANDTITTANRFVLNSTVADYALKINNTVDGGLTVSGNTYGIFSQASAGAALGAYSTGAIAADIRTTRTSNNTIETILDLYRQNNTFVGADGIGGRIDINVNHSTGVSRAGSFAAKYTNATAATRIAEIDITLDSIATSTTAMNIQNSGIVRVNNNADTLATKAYARSVGGGGGGGSGDVVGPASATDGVPALFDGTTGKLIKNSTPTGTGNPVMQTTPTFNTNITTPLVIGGTSTTQTLTYKTTTGVGATGADHIFQVGNNGATEAMRILNNGNVGIGISPTQKLHILGNQLITPTADGTSTMRINIAGGNAGLQFGSYPAVTSYGSIWAGNITPSGTNYMLAGDGTTETLFNGASLKFRINNASSPTAMTISSSSRVGVNVNSPNALFHVAASTSAASTASIKINEGARQTTPEDGTLNYVSNNLEFTETSTVYTLAKTLTNTATLDFASTGAGAVADLTITVTGAADGDAVVIGVPNGSVTATATYSAWVSAANTVTVRFSPKATEDPASGTFRVSIIKY